jgi:hypothetical protein
LTHPNLDLEQAQEEMCRRLQNRKQPRVPKLKIKHTPDLITFLPSPAVHSSTSPLKLIPYTDTYTEFELQADTWWRLNGDGFYTRGEVDSDTGRLDLVVYFNPQSYLPLAVIEAKRSRQSTWEMTTQGANYLKLGVPIILYWKHEQYVKLVNKLMDLRVRARRDRECRYAEMFPHDPSQALSHAPMGLSEIIAARYQR